MESREEVGKKSKANFTVNSQRFRPEEIVSNHYHSKIQEEEEMGLVGFVKGLFSWFFDFAQVIIIALAIFVVCWLFIVSPHTIQQISMQPNFCEGYVLLADKLTPRFNHYKVGDVIVFKWNEQDDYIKRIIGVGGDKLKFLDGKVYRNGEVMNEPYLPQGRTTTLKPGSGLVEGQEYTVPPNQYFMMGDNRDYSLDSRVFLAIDPAIHPIKGRVILIMWPFNRIRAFDNMASQPVNDCAVK